MEVELSFSFLVLTAMTPRPKTHFKVKSTLWERRGIVWLKSRVLFDLFTYFKSVHLGKLKKIAQPHLTG